VLSEQYREVKVSEPFLGIIAVEPSEWTRSDWMQVLWGFWWRGVCFAISAGIAGFIIGCILGILVGIAMAILGIPRELYTTPLQVTGFILGLGIGFYLLRFYIRWLVKARFGSLQLVFVRTAKTVSEPVMVVDAT
jgi:hypothetical protein